MGGVGDKLVATSMRCFLPLVVIELFCMFTTNRAHTPNKGLGKMEEKREILAWWHQEWQIEEKTENHCIITLTNGTKMKLSKKRGASGAMETLLNTNLLQIKLMASLVNGLSTTGLSILIGTDEDPEQTMETLHQLGYLAQKITENQEEKVFYYVPEELHKEIVETPLQEKIGIIKPLGKIL
ncbi:MAG: hypothetical protein DRO11_07915 [Methanobacteriota archaeon]|nr:MAG: hypothetical protein DRO11_07915 [Euryarchaeota archaeon]